MAGKRRTKKQKKMAMMHRQVSSFTFRPQTSQKEEKKEIEKSQLVSKLEVENDLRTIRMDLTKTVGVTILALILQLAIYIYLQRGGWALVLSKLQQINL